MTKSWFETQVAKPYFKLIKNKFLPLTAEWMVPAAARNLIRIHWKWEDLRHSNRRCGTLHSFRIWWHTKFKFQIHLRVAATSHRILASLLRVAFGSRTANSIIIWVFWHNCCNLFANELRQYTIRMANSLSQTEFPANAFQMEIGDGDAADSVNGEHLELI